MSRRVFALVVSICATACRDDVVSPNTDAAAAILDSVAVPATNVLSRRVFARLSNADSAWVIVTGVGDQVQRTPAARVSDGPQEFLVLGLRQSTQYSLQVVARSSGGRLTTSDPIPMTTDSVPAPLRAVRFDVTGTASAGFTMFHINVDSTGYVVIFDSLGALRWYFSASPFMPNGNVGDVRQLRGGGFLVYLGLSSGWQPVVGRFVQISNGGTIVRSIPTPAPLYTDNHEIVPLYDGDSLTGALFAAYDLRTVDMTTYGGADTAQIAGHYLLRQTLGGGTEFFWSAWDHLRIVDWIEEPLAFKARSPFDFDHPNAIAIDRDGNYVVSWRHLGEINKIDARTGAILWRWGGANNQFSFVDDPLGFFSGQHSIVVLANGNYLLYDNGLRHAPPESRAAEYRLDPRLRTATLVWQYRHSPPIYTPFTGSVQRLSNGNTLIGWAGVAVASEVTPGGQLAWEGRLTHPRGVITYRATRIGNLYRSVEP
ncbi:MAG: aryl-sulfate sulfotransferase [Gemmatimonadetes bacterium]|nr:aryl-sulfate sulfotransferase [Gemmatimonadota bacterium]